MSDYIDVNALQTNPERALNKGEKFYKAEITDQKTGETSYVARPIFIIKNKKKEELSIHSAHLARFFELSNTLIFLRHSALGTIIRYKYTNGAYVQISDDDIKRILRIYIEEYNSALVSVWAITQALCALRQNF